MTTEILIYGEIGFDVTAQYVAAEMEAADGDDLHVRVNSPGGSGSDGIAIYNRLKEYPGHVQVTIDGAAMSAGSIIAMAGDHIEMAANAFLMIHDSWADISGNAKEMSRQARTLEKFDQQQARIYAERTGKSLEEVERLMDREDTLDATEALSVGFVDAITGESRIAANLNKDKIMARARTTKKVAAKKAAPKRRPVKKSAKAKTRAVSVEIEDEEDDILSEDEELAMDDEEMAEDETHAMTPDEAEHYAMEDEEMAEDDDESMAMEEDEEYAEDDDAPQAASYRQIIRACAGINPKSAGDAKFIAHIQGKGATVAQASRAWMRHLKARADRNSGVDPVSMTRSRSGGQSSGGTAVARFNAAVRERMKLAKCSRTDATKIVAKSDPELHRAYLIQTNKRSVRESINERFRG